MDPKTESRIRERAYQMWLEDGSPHGKPDAYWYRAEQEILSAEAMDASQISAHEEGPDRDAERLGADGDQPTAGEAGPGHPQKPGEKLQDAAPITAPKQRAKAKAAPSATPAVPQGDASAGPASSYGASSNAPAEAAAAAAGRKTGAQASEPKAPAAKASAPAKAASPKASTPKAPSTKSPRPGKTVN